MIKDYRIRFFEKYVSAFKGASPGVADVEFQKSKLEPLISDWVGNLSRDVPVVDLGCGSGGLVYTLQSLGFSDIRACDLSSEQVELARKVLPSAYVADLREEVLHLPADTFGAVFLFDVLEHLTKKEIFDVLEHVHRILRPCGILVVHGPNGDSPFVGAIRYGDFTHETVFTPCSAQQLTKLLRFVDFDSREHLGASLSLSGGVRWLVWKGIRLGLTLWNLVETGGRGAGVWTRNFAFKVSKGR